MVRTVDRDDPGIHRRYLAGVDIINRMPEECGPPVIGEDNLSEPGFNRQCLHFIHSPAVPGIEISSQYYRSLVIFDELSDVLQMSVVIFYAESEIDQMDIDYQQCLLPGFIQRVECGQCCFGDRKYGFAHAKRANCFW